jgi:hypothetical protein
MKDRECLDMIEKQLGKQPKKKEKWFKEIKEDNKLLDPFRKKEEKKK